MGHHDVAVHVKPAKPRTRVTSLAQRLGAIKGVRSAKLIARIPPQLAQLVERAPSGDDWLHEIKFDGYRLGARLDRGHVSMLTRKGLDWTAKFPGIAAAIGKLDAETAWLEGEACHLDAEGRSSFSGLQDDLSNGRSERVFFFAFDLLHLNGFDLTGAALDARKAELAELLKRPPSPIMLSDHVIGDGIRFHERACGMQLEGIVSKRRDAPYRSGRSGLWVKAKCLNREEFVVVGWTDPEGARMGFGSLLLGYYTPAGELLFAGRVGTGFSTKKLSEIAAKLKPLARAKTPLARIPEATGNRYGFGTPFKWSEAHWVRPTLVAEVTYLTWTGDGFLRHVSFQGMREDKPAREVVREPPGHT